MEALGKRNGVKKGSVYLSTHPAGDERIAKQKEWMDSALQVSVNPAGMCALLWVSFLNAFCFLENAAGLGDIMSKYGVDIKKNTSHLSLTETGR